jgi:hypothetical protein
MAQRLFENTGSAKQFRREVNLTPYFYVIASGAKQSIGRRNTDWIASSPVAPRNDGGDA